MNTEQTTELPTAGLLRRLGAFAYDILLLMALIVIAGFIALPFTGGEAPHSGNPYYQTYLFILSFSFFAWFWTRGGQTLGMRAWRLRVQNDDGSAISWSQALLRFMSGVASMVLIGAGFYFMKSEPNTPVYFLGIAAWVIFVVSFLWILVDKKKLAWQDHFSSCKVVVLPKLDKKY